MCAKDILEIYRMLDIAISNREAEIDHLEEIATRVSASSSGGSRNSEVSDKVGRISAAIADEKKALEDEITKLMELKQEAKKILNRIPNLKEREMVRMRYILGCTYAEIAEKFFYCKKSVRHKINSAIEKIP